MLNFTTPYFTSVPSIQTDKFHWVCADIGYDYSLFLANEQNEMLSCPVLQNITDSEKQLINNYMNWYEDFEDGKFSSDCFPSSKTGIIIVTAPLYRQPAGGDAIFHFVKDNFTETWIDPRKIQNMNKFILEHISREKIVSPGCYVDMKDI